MSYWGWRPLIGWWFISVLVVSCSSNPPLTPPSTPTDYPPITLTIRQSASPTASSVTLPTVSPTQTPSSPTELPSSTPTPVIYTVQEGDTLLGIAITFGVEVADIQAANDGIDPLALQVGQQLIIPPPRVIPAPGITPSAANLMPTSTPLALMLDTPACYPTPGGLTCLGSVYNPLQTASERVAVLVRLLHSDGTVLAEEAVAIEQRLLPAGNAAPYRVQFAAPQSDYRPSAALLSADTAPDVENRFISLEVRGENVVIEEGRYIVTATLYNPGPQSALAVRATLTVWGGDGHVLGYRVMQVRDTLLMGEELPLHIEVMPQEEDSAATHTLYIEAQRGQ